MNLFEGKLDISDAYAIDESTYKIIGEYTDNTGTFVAAQVSEGDIIYADGTMLGYTLLRYKVKTVNRKEMEGSTIVVEAIWDMADQEVVEPCGGLDGIIGAIHPNGLTANVPAFVYNGINEVLTTRANSYQAMLLGKNSGGGGETPDLSTIKKDVNDLKEKVSSIQLEWEDLMTLSYE